MTSVIDEVADETSAVERIDAALQEQSTGCRTAVDFLRGVHQSTQSNEESVRQLDEAISSLLTNAEELRGEVDRFRV